MITALLAAALVTWAPPPAYGNGHKLAQSSYCWGTVCADFVPYRCGDRDVPTIGVARGTLLRLRFGFQPTAVSVGVAGRQANIAPRRSTTWRATRAGTLFVFATAKQGDTSYIGCVRLKS